jgi:ATP-dependent Clp protease ATP-binding subunit ClpA
MRPRSAAPLVERFRARPRPALSLADRTRFALLDPRRTRVYAGGFAPTPQATRVLGLTRREALALGHHDVGTGHLLLALLREGHGIAARELTALGADHARAREQVLSLLTSADEHAGPRTTLVRLAIPAGLTDAAERQWAAGADVQAVVAENQRVHRELDRLRGLLREHGIEPDDGTARTA